MIDSATFVKSAMEQLGCESPAQLAELMRWKRGTERLVAKWLAGQNKPGFDYTLELAERCGWFSMSADAPGQAVSSADPLEEVKAGVAALLLGQAEIRSLIGETQSDERQAQKPAARKRTASSRKGR